MEKKIPYPRVLYTEHIWMALSYFLLMTEFYAAYIGIKMKWENVDGKAENINNSILAETLHMKQIFQIVYNE